MLTARLNSLRKKCFRLLKAQFDFEFGVLAGSHFSLDGGGDGLC